MPYIVTGISQNGDIASLEQALASAGLPLDSLQVIGPEDAPAESGSSLIPTGMITGGGLETGTGVPGLTGSGTPGISGGEMILHGGSLWDRLSDLAIPDDEVENYAEALEAGRTLVAYFAQAGNAASVEQVFVAGGLSKIKTF